MESHDTVAEIARALTRSLWCLTFSFLLTPGVELAAKSHVTFVVAPGNVATNDMVTIMEVPDAGADVEHSSSKVRGVSLPTANKAVTFLKNGIPINKGVSDKRAISSRGTIAVENGGEGSSDLVPALTSGTAVTEGPEGTTKPVSLGLLGTKGRTLGTTTLVVFNNGAPESGTMLLFGTGLLAFGAILRRKSKTRSGTASLAYWRNAERKSL